MMLKYAMQIWTSFIEFRVVDWWAGINNVGSRGKLGEVDIILWGGMLMEGRQVLKHGRDQIEGEMA